VPWCDTCDRRVEDDELEGDDACPDCGHALRERRKVPWHFKLFVYATVIYLGYRTFQGITWLVHHA
jgi:DNA-directed RNA polymerase subunit RPC12/RpoP